MHWKLSCPLHFTSALLLLHTGDYENEVGHSAWRWHGKKSNCILSTDRTGCVPAAEAEEEAAAAHNSYPMEPRRQYSACGRRCLFLTLASFVDVTTSIMNHASWQVRPMYTGLRSRAMATWRFCTDAAVHLLHKTPPWVVTIHTANRQSNGT